MEVSAIAAQQSLFRLNMGISMVKANADMQQKIVEMVASTVDSARGQNLNISI